MCVSFVSVSLCQHLADKFINNLIEPAMHQALGNGCFGLSKCLNAQNSCKIMNICNCSVSTDSAGQAGIEAITEGQER